MCPQCSTRLLRVRLAYQYASVAGVLVRHNHIAGCEHGHHGGGEAEGVLGWNAVVDVFSKYMEVVRIIDYDVVAQMTELCVYF